jgi:hypothetical protein
LIVFAEIELRPGSSRTPLRRHPLPHRGDDRVDGSATSGTPATEADQAPTGALPRISDYWPDAPHRMSPAADYYPDSAEAPAGPAYPEEPPPLRVLSPPTPPRRSRLRLFLGALAVLVFVGGSVLALGRMVLRTQPAAAPQVSAAAPVEPVEPTASAPAASPPVSIEPADPAEPAPSPTTAPATEPPAKAAALPFSSGTFELVSNVAELHVTVATLGADPVRVSVPKGSGLIPRLSRDGSTVRLTAKDDGSEGSGRIDVQLNRKVTWSLRMTGGAREQDFALAKAMVRRIDLNGGVAEINMTLPTPAETLPIRMAGGVNTWHITTATRVPVKVLLRDGGGEVVLNGDRTRGIDRGTRLSDGRGEGGLDIDAVEGLGTLIVDSAGGTG